MRRMVLTVALVRRMERRQIRPAHQVADVMPKVSLREPLAHIRCLRKRLVRLVGAIIGIGSSPSAPIRLLSHHLLRRRLSWERHLILGLRGPNLGASHLPCAEGASDIRQIADQSAAVPSCSRCRVEGAFEAVPVRPERPQPFPGPDGNLLTARPHCARAAAVRFACAVPCSRRS